MIQRIRTSVVDLLSLEEYLVKKRNIGFRMKNLNLDFSRSSYGLLIKERVPIVCSPPPRPRPWVTSGRDLGMTPCYQTLSFALRSRNQALSQNPLVNSRDILQHENRSYV